MPYERAKWTLLVVSILLTVAGIAFIASASSYWSAVHYPTSTPFWIKQSLFAVLAFGVFTLVRRFKFQGNVLTVFYIVGILAALTVWVPGLGIVRNGARGWITLGGFYFQPAELTKVSTLLFLSQVRYKTNSLVYPLLVVLLPSALFMLQPDFGSTFLLVGTTGIVLFLTGLSWRMIAAVIGLGMISLIGLIASAPYRLARITSFLDPWKDPLGTGFQSIQSQLAIGPAGILGWGSGQSRQKLLFLPEPQNDFIFALIIEENGWLMALVLCAAYVTWGLCCFQLASFYSFTVQGIQIAALGSLMMIQTGVNLGVVTGLLPVTGVTLPFISYGGSSLMSSWILCGIILSLYHHGREAEEWKN